MLDIRSLKSKALTLKKTCFKPVHTPFKVVDSKKKAAQFTRVHLGIQPDVIQQEVLNDNRRMKVCVWGRQRGKTITALLWILERAIRIPNSVNWYVAPTYKQAKQIAWDKAKLLYPWELFSAKPNESELCFRFNNGSKLYLKGAEDPHSLRGATLHSAVLDEYGTMKRTAWSQGVKPALAANEGHAFFIGTPNAYKGPHLEELWRSIQSGKVDGYWKHQKTSDAPHITEAEIKSAKEQLMEWEFEQEYGAEFKELAGRVWTEFRDSFIHDTPAGHKFVADNKTQASCPKGWHVICGLDFGCTHPLAAVWIAVGPSQQIQVLAEYSAPRRRFDEHANAIKEISALYGGVSRITFVGDPSAPQMAEEFQEEGILVTGANNSVERGIERVGRLFAHNYLTVAACCTKLIKGISHYVWDVNSSRPRVLKINDDECDALRYAVMEAQAPDAFSRKLEDEDNRIDGYAEDSIFTDDLLDTNWITGGV